MNGIVLTHTCGENWKEETYWKFCPVNESVFELLFL